MQPSAVPINQIRAEMAKEWGPSEALRDRCIAWLDSGKPLENCIGVSLPATAGTVRAPPRS